jgi:plasmid maintenance system antidote protein VapI
MSGGLAYLNLSAQPQSLAGLNDFWGGGNYDGRMAAPPRFDWYLKEWLMACDKKQADIVKDLDWNKAKVSLIVNGKQPYTGDDIAELASYLQIRQHELLMHPEEAFHARRLKAELIRLVHDSETEEVADDGKKVSLN